MNENETFDPELGGTLRDYFAGWALAGWLAAPGQHGENVRESPTRAAKWSYEIADAMLEERKRRHFEAND